MTPEPPSDAPHTCSASLTLLLPTSPGAEAGEGGGEGGGRDGGGGEGGGDSGGGDITAPLVFGRGWGLRVRAADGWRRGGSRSGAPHTTAPLPFFGRTNPLPMLLMQRGTPHNYKSSQVKSTTMTRRAEG